MVNEALAEKYAAGRHWDKHTEDYAIEFAKHLTERRHDSLVVDLGCGAGRDVAVLNSRGFKKTIGIDIAPWEIARARRNHPTLDFKVGDINQLPFGDGSVGAFYCVNVIHYLDQQKVIENVHRKLVLSGLFFVHFNISITDETGRVDYCQDIDSVLALVKPLETRHIKFFRRVDQTPFPHTHQIMEMLLEKRGL